MLKAAARNRATQRRPRHSEPFLWRQYSWPGEPHRHRDPPEHLEAPATGKCLPTPAPTCCREDAQESGRLPGQRPFRISPQVSNERTRAAKRRRGGPAAIGGLAPCRIHPEACRNWSATWLPHSQNPFPWRLDSRVLRGGYIAGASAERWRAILARRRGVPWGRGCWRESSRYRAAAYSFLSCHPGTKCLCRSPRRGRRQSSPVRLALQDLVAKECPRTISAA